MTRRPIALLAAVVLAVLAGPMAPAAGQETGSRPVGTADTELDLGTIVLEGLPDGGVALGSLRAFASTDENTERNPEGRPFALARVGLPGGDSDEVRSDGESSREARELPLGELGSVEIGAMEASASEQSAAATVESLRSRLQLAAGELSAGAGATRTAVSQERALAANNAALSGLAIELTDVIPLPLLAELPLDQLLDLLDLLELDLDLGALDEALEQVSAVVDQVDEVGALRSEIAGARDTLAETRDELAAAEDTASAAAATVSTLEEELSGATEELGGLEETLTDLEQEWEDLGCDLLVTLSPECQELEEEIEETESSIADTEANITDLEEQLAAAEADLADAEALVEQLEGEVASLVDEIDALVAELADALDLLGELADTIEGLDLAALVDAIIDGLQGTELLAIDEVSVGIEAVAASTDASARAACDVEGVRVLGEARPVSSCEQLSAALGDVGDLLSGLVANLPLAGAVPADLVTVAAPRTERDTGEHEGVRFASASVGELTLALDSVELTGVAEGFVAELTALAGGALGELDAVEDLDVDLDALIAELEQVLGAVSELPLGAELEGLQTPELSVSALGLGARSTFVAAGDEPDPVDEPPASPDEPGPSPTPLPSTGGGPGPALALLAAGSGLVLWLSRRPQPVRGR